HAIMLEFEATVRPQSMTVRTKPLSEKDDQAHPVDGERSTSTGRRLSDQERDRRLPPQLLGAPPRHVPAAEPRQGAPGCGLGDRLEAGAGHPAALHEVPAG